MAETMAETTVSNCWLWSRAMYRQRIRQWEAAGMPVGREPFWCKRPSRNEPRKVCGIRVWHYFVGELDAHGRIVVQSFKPIRPTDVPPWLAWTHAWFEGVPTVGDRPEPWADTAPTAPGELA